MNNTRNKRVLGKINHIIHNFNKRYAGLFSAYGHLRGDEQQYNEYMSELPYYKRLLNFTI